MPKDPPKLRISLQSKGPEQIDRLVGQCRDRPQLGELVDDDDADGDPDRQPDAASGTGRSALSDG